MAVISFRISSAPSFGGIAKCEIGAASSKYFSIIFLSNLYLEDTLNG